jgi:hypothetical protein
MTTCMSEVPNSQHNSSTAQLVCVGKGVQGCRLTRGSADYSRYLFDSSGCRVAGNKRSAGMEDQHLMSESGDEFEQFLRSMQGAYSWRVLQDVGVK